MNSETSESKQTIDFSPKYVQVYNSLRSGIILHKNPPGSFLPTEKQLMESYSAGRTTIRRALSLLQEEGLIEARQGSGSMILALRGDENRKFNTDKWEWRAVTTLEYYSKETNHTFTPLVIDTVPAPIYVAKAFGIDTESEVHRAQRVWLLNEVPCRYMIQYIRSDAMLGLERYTNDTRTLYEVLDKHYNLKPVDWEEHISARVAGFIESNILNVPIGSPILYTYRIATIESGPFEYAEFFSNPELIGYKTKEGEHSEDR